MLTKISLALVLLMGAALAQEMCTLQTYASSWMKTGTPFSVQCDSEIYTGVLVSIPARRFFKRGSLRLKFNGPLAVVTKNAEGVIKPSRGRQITSMMLAGGSGIGTKDMMDGLSGAIFKSYYMIPITFGVVAVFEKGGDVNLKPGYQIKVESTR